ncbi:MAG: glycosyltransferase [Ignavibacteriaceae bacterium]|nr:glycosyltransferase [Ignavibacteriaceae bacterium]
MISVLLPTFNSEKFIAPCIQSILNQTFEDFELLIVDSCSTDKTIDVIKTFTDSRINLHQIVRSPLSTSLNYGLNAAKFDLVARMDSDDVMHENRLRNQLIFKNENPEVDIITCRFAYFNEKGILYSFSIPERHEEISDGLRLHNIVCNPGAFFDKRIVLEAGGYNDIIVEDYELWLRLLPRVRFYCLPETLVYMRYRKDSRSREYYKQTNLAVYLLQEQYFRTDYEKLSNKKNELLGWREFFYGNKSMARFYWSHQRNSVRTLSAYLLTFLPENVFERIKEYRIVLRLRYLLSYFSLENKLIRSDFKRLIS